VTGDVAGTAEMFVHAPYLWGGRESLGLDCSALVQNAFQAAGRTIPRDTGDQEPALAGETHVKPDDLARGDVVFWPGHVAIAIDHTRVIHANATAMAVSIDALTDLAARIQAQEGRAVSSIVRVGRDPPALTPDRPAMTVGMGADPRRGHEPEQGA
jgi:cell wall-associated NlpC family hydrolase